MNREIKFRAWHNEANKMLHDNAKNIFMWDDEGQRIEIMQFTGLKDKNGKEIYEGDIIKSDDGAVVQLYWDLCGFSSKVIKKSESIKTNYFTNLWQSRDFEVIGNIYQNLDLLK